jgi:dCMP deaminase
MTWDEWFIEFAKVAALKSKDRSTKVGAVIVTSDKELISVGYNGFCRGLNDDIDERHERPAKYDYTSHAEENAVINAARIGVSLKNCTMYQNYAPTSCVTCARAIIQAGIKCSVGPPIPFPGKRDWVAQLDIGVKMMMEAGVKLYVYENGTRMPLYDWLRRTQCLKRN